MLNLSAIFPITSLFLIAVSSSSGFVVIAGRPSIPRDPAVRYYGHNLDSSDTYYTTTISPSSLYYAVTANSSRRNFVEQSIAATIFSRTTTLLPTTTTPLFVLIAPQAAAAKEQVVESAVTTRQTVSDAFHAIRTELSSPTGLISTLTKLIDSNSCPEIMQYTKESDAYFRKAKLGRARKLLTDGASKKDAILMSNAVTFDLIGLNRASRPGKENREEQMKYLGELREDIERFLELESTIVVPGE